MMGLLLIRSEPLKPYQTEGHFVKSYSRAQSLIEDVFFVMIQGMPNKEKVSPRCRVTRQIVLGGFFKKPQSYG